MNDKLKRFFRSLIYSLFGAFLLFSILVMVSVGPIRDLLDQIPLGSMYIAGPLQLIMFFLVLIVVSIVQAIISRTISFILPILTGLISFILLLIFLESNYSINLTHVNLSPWMNIGM